MYETQLVYKMLESNRLWLNVYISFFSEMS